MLLFVTRKANSEEVASSLKSEGHQLGLLHGDMTQGNRDDVITAFRRNEFPILVATDVAGEPCVPIPRLLPPLFAPPPPSLSSHQLFPLARGLDIPSIRTVINFDVAKDIDTHVHRIGRTGRAGEKGSAFTLLTPRDVNFAGDLVRNLVRPHNIALSYHVTIM